VEGGEIAIAASFPATTHSAQAIIKFCPFSQGPPQSNLLVTVLILILHDLSFRLILMAQHLLSPCLLNYVFNVAY
jgi:hypothetical protein